MMSVLIENGPLTTLWLIKSVVNHSTGREGGAR